MGKIPLSHTYVRQLMKKDYGYPLWIPEPSRSLPSSYVERGFSIGDVGVLTEEGSFEPLFNIFRSANDSINAGRVPVEFRPAPIKQAEIRVTKNFHPPKTILTVGSSRSAEMRGDASLSAPHAPIEAGAGIAFQTSSLEGARLVLDEGTTLEKLSTAGKVVKIALSEAPRWYQWAREQGWIITDDQLVIICGTVKTTTFSLTAFSKANGKSSFSMKLRAAGVGGGEASSRQDWDEGYSSETRVSDNPNRYRNQTVFVHVIPITMRAKLPWFKKTISAGVSGFGRRSFSPKVDKWFHARRPYTLRWKSNRSR